MMVMQAQQPQCVRRACEVLLFYFGFSRIVFRPDSLL